MDYYPRFCGENAGSWYAALARDLDWRQERFVMFGREVTSPRLVAFAGEPGVRYRYSGLDHVADGWPSVLPAIKTALIAAAGQNFNCVLANLYRDGSDYMGWHSDDEQSLGVNPVIASVSLGAERDFVLRRRDDRDRKLAVALTHGSLLLMSGALQHHWQHSLPARRVVSEPRINLTFRSVRG